MTINLYRAICTPKHYKYKYYQLVQLIFLWDNQGIFNIHK